MRGLRNEIRNFQDIIVVLGFGFESGKRGFLFERAFEKGELGAGSGSGDRSLPTRSLLFFPI